MIGLMDCHLAIGTQVCLRLEEIHPKGRMEIPNCEVIDIKQEGIYINTPTIDSIYLEGRKVEIIWEMDMFFYCLSSKIIECVNKLDTQLLVAFSNTLRFIDERKYFKLKHPINIEFRPMKSNCLFINAECIDVSGGGIRFFTNYPLNSGEKLEMQIDVPIFPYLNFTAFGEVIIVKRFKEIDGLEIGICFFDIDPVGKKRLFKYILDEQQPLRSKGGENKGELEFFFP